MSFDHLGKSFRIGTEEGRAAFRRHVSGQRVRCAGGVCFHHTAMPTLAMRPDGLTPAHLRNIRDYYAGLGWRRGPHLFADDLGVHCLTPLSERGAHAPAFNESFVGIEVLGDYGREDPSAGRGLAAWRNAAAAAAVVLSAQGHGKGDFMAIRHLKFHRDDPKTDKTCPGRRVAQEWVASLVIAALAQEPQEDAQHDDDAPEPSPGGSSLPRPANAPVLAFAVSGGRVLSPLQDTLERLGGGDAAYDSPLWAAVAGKVYDAAHETTWAPLAEILRAAEAAAAEPPTPS